MTDDNEDTNVTSTRDLEMDLLVKIDDKLERLENRVETLIQDVDTVHKFQRSFAERLSTVEKFCVERPLRSIPMKNKPFDGDNGG